MNKNIKQISAHRRLTGLVMALVVGVHIVSGSGIFCANLRPFIAFAALWSAASDHDRGRVLVSTPNSTDNQSGPSNCCCKKKCPAIPRSAIVSSNPTHRFHSGEFQAKSACYHSLVHQMTDHRFAARGDWPLMELARSAPLFGSNPLSLTCVLLI